MLAVKNKKRHFNFSAIIGQFGETVNAPSLTAKINRMIAGGVSFKIEADDFEAFAATESENAFLAANKRQALFVLQRGSLINEIFQHSPELLEDFQTEVHERSAIMSDGGGEIVFQALAQVCAEWITEAIENENG